MLVAPVLGGQNCRLTGIVYLVIIKSLRILIIQQETNFLAAGWAIPFGHRGIRNHSRSIKLLSNLPNFFSNYMNIV